MSGELADCMAIIEMLDGVSTFSSAKFCELDGLIAPGRHTGPRLLPDPLVPV